jgi:hypothetical protein
MQIHSVPACVMHTDDAFILYLRNHVLTMWVVPFADLKAQREAGDELPGYAERWWMELRRPGCAGLQLEFGAFGAVPEKKLVKPFRVNQRRALEVWDAIDRHYRIRDDITPDGVVPYELKRQKSHAVRIAA